MDAEATAVGAALNGAGPVTLRTVAGGEIIVMFANRRDALKKVQETIDLLEAAGGKIAMCLVVGDARV